MAAAAPDAAAAAAPLLRLWRRGARRAAAWLAGLLLVLLGPAPAAAHPMPESRLWIDTAPRGVVLTLQLPLNRLELAYGQPLSAAPRQVLEKHAEGLSRYLLQHVGARSGAAGWQALRPRLTVTGSDAASGELEAVLDLRAPAGADPRVFTLLYDAVTHEVRTHRGLAYLRNDWAAGHVGEPPRLLGVVDAERNALPVALDEAHVGSSVMRLFDHGARHIAEGTDHLLFLLTLLLVAPLTAVGHRWAGVRPVRPAVGRLLAVVTAFTLGHSLTLALGSTGVVSLPAQWVEVAVAASIVVAGAHALRPLASRGEILMAGGFGLLHGLAFAASLSGAGLTPWQHAQALLAFNLGIEAMQLAVVACVMPPLLVLAQAAPRRYAALRAGTGLLAAAAATSWIVERLAPQHDGAAQWVEAAAAAAPALAAMLWGAAAAAWLARRQQGAAVRS